MIVLSREILNRLMLWHLLAGAVVGVFVLQPINDLLYYLQNDDVIRAAPDAPNALAFVVGELKALILGPRWLKGVFYAGVGALIGTMTGIVSIDLTPREDE